MRLFILTLILYFLLSCHSESNVEKQLSAAFTLMDQNPDGGLKFISNIDTSAIRTDRERALYSLAYAQAFCKEFGYIDSAAIVTPAIEYFLRHKDDYYLMLSLYYSGEGYFHQKLYDKATSDFIHAGRLADKLNNDFYLGLIYRDLRSVLTRVNIFQQAETFAKESLDAFIRVGNPIYIGYAYLDYAFALHNNAKPDEALKQTSVALRYANELADKDLETDVYYAEAISNLSMKKYKEAYEAYRKSFAVDSTYLNALDRKNMVWALFLSGDRDGAEALFTKLQQGDSTLRFKPVEMYEADGDYYNAYLAKKAEYAYAESEIQKTFGQSVTKTIDEFNHREALREARRAVRYRAWVWGVGCTAALIICLICVIFILYRKARRRERDEMDATIGSLHESLTELQREADAVRADYENARREMKPTNPLQSVRDKFGYLNSLCSEYYSTDAPVRQKAGRLAEKIQKEIDRMRDDKKFQRSIEAKFNSATGGLMAAMRADYPGLKEQDYLLVLYSGLGFTSKAVAVLLDSETGALYTRRWRLAAKISEGQSARREELLALIRM